MSSFLSADEYTWLLKILIIGDSQSAIINAQGKPITYTYPNYLKPKLNDFNSTPHIVNVLGCNTFE